jgi:hypothetical protein
MSRVSKHRHYRESIIVFLSIFILAPVIASFIFVAGDLVLSLIVSLTLVTKLSMSEIADWLIGTLTVAYSSVFIYMLLPAIILAVITLRFGFFSKRSIVFAVLCSLVLKMLISFILIGLTRMRYFIDWTSDLEFQLWQAAYFLAAILIIRYFLIWKGAIVAEKMQLK